MKKKRGGEKKKGIGSSRNISYLLTRGFFAGFVASSFEGGWLWIWWLLRFWNAKEIRHLHHGLGSGINFDTSTLLAL
jgi:hypothetical protein